VKQASFPPIAEHDTGAPPAGAALVLARWHSWVRVWIPDRGEITWVNLDETSFRTVAPAHSADSDATGATGPPPHH